LGKGAKYYDYVPIFPYSHERIDAAINFYKAKGIDNIYGLHLKGQTQMLSQN
jgi:vancomycin permeability regulator SanA